MARPPPEPDPTQADPGSGHPNPWYLRIFLGRNRLPEGTLNTLWLVSLAMFFENYDMGLVNAALPQIAEDLEIATGNTGFYLGAIRLGGLGTFLVLPFADRLGRRRVFLAALVGMSLGTFACAWAQTALQFALLQMATRVFMLTGAALSLVILVEEFPAEHRGAGIALLSVLGGLGFAVGAGLYAGIDYLPGGWRALYMVGLGPLLLLPLFRRSLRETRRYEAHARTRSTQQRAHPLRAWAEPVAMLMRERPGRTAAVGLAGLLAAMSTIAFFQYTSFFLQNVHGWSPGHYTLLVYGGGMLGLLGNLIGGRGSDTWGRKRVGVTTMLLLPLAVAFFYQGPSSTLAFAWGLAALCATSNELIIRAVSTELFPTSHRGAASGWLILVQTIGWSSGLFLIALGTESTADLGLMISMVSLAALGAAVCLFIVPETRRLELETITGDEVAGTPPSA